jgi:nucleotide-binding universal stress UspA family protein
VKPIRRILVPVDFSECSRSALLHAIEMARAFEAQITALHVWTLPAAESRVRAASGQTLESMANDEARRSMSEFLAPTIESSGFEKIEAKIAIGAEAEMILETAKDYDMVVMGTNGRTGLSYWILGSVAEKVVRRAPCPVLTVRSPSS